MITKIVKPSFQEDSGIPGYHQIENDNLLEEVLQLCHHLSKKPPASERIKKELLKRSTTANIEDARTVEFKNFTRRMISREAREVFKVFLEHREPDFSKFK